MVGIQMGNEPETVRIRRRRKPLKLFVWTEFSPDYTSGLAVALAKDEGEARTAIVKQHGYTPSEWGTLTVYPVSRRMAVSVAGGA